jgi:hypothetical protein
MNNILKELNIKNSLCTSWNRIYNSTFNSIVPSNAPIDCEVENKEKYGLVPQAEFKEPVFYENICLIKLSDSFKCQSALNYVKSFANG